MDFILIESEGADWIQLVRGKFHFFVCFYCVRLAPDWITFNYISERINRFYGRTADLREGIWKMLQFLLWFNCSYLHKVAKIESNYPWA